MSRFFAFGCSHVNYQYPTWADMLIESLSQDNVEGFNCGRIGSGNLTIGSRIWDIHARYKYNSDDVIIISWSNFFREDRYHTQGGWHCPGNIFKNRTTYPFTFNNYRYNSERDTHDLMHYLMRDCMIITSTVEGLKATGATVYTTHMNNPYKDETLLSMPDESRILDMYRPWIEGSFESIMNHCWYEGVGVDKSRPRYRNEMAPLTDIIEDHPLPLEHYDYLKNIIAPYTNIKINKSIEDYANYWQNRLFENDQGYYPLEDWHTKEPEWPFG